MRLLKQHAIVTRQQGGRMNITMDIPEATRAEEVCDAIGCEKTLNAVSSLLLQYQMAFRDGL